MNKNIKLSICITAFNQLDIVRKNIENLLLYKGDDIEIIVSDDHSSENIEGLVSAFNDQRLLYTCTPQNGGHDLNIINAIEHAQGEFVLILRSRDTLIAETIPKVLQTLDFFDKISYAVFSAFDEEGKQKLVFSDKVYPKGKAAIKAHTKLFVHPSGNFYRKKLLETTVYKKCIKEIFNHKFGFTVHELIRMDLACKGDFITSSMFVWVYPNSAKQKDVAVNTIGKGESVYSPKLSYERCKCEFNYINHYLNANNQYKYLLNKHIMCSFFKKIAYDFNKINKVKEMKKHYNYEEVKFYACKERKNYSDFIISLLKKENIYNAKKLRTLVWLYSLKIAFYYPVRDYLLHEFLSDEQFLMLAKAVKRL